MKDTTQQLLIKIDEVHDFREGAPYRQVGNNTQCTDVCRVCSLRRHYSFDPPNQSEGEYRFSDGETGEDLSLRQALSRGCLEV